MLTRFYILGFQAVVALIQFCGSIAGWFHDRAQRQVGAQTQVIADQHAIIQTMRDALTLPQIKTRVELEARLKKGDL